MQFPETGSKARKDTTPAVAAADLVLYRVVETVFVNGRIEHPVTADGEENFVRAARGLEGRALELAAPPKQNNGPQQARK